MEVKKAILEILHMKGGSVLNDPSLFRACLYDFCNDQKKSLVYIIYRLLKENHVLGSIANSSFDEIEARRIRFAMKENFGFDEGVVGEGIRMWSQALSNTGKAHGSPGKKSPDVHRKNAEESSGRGDYCSANKSIAAALSIEPENPKNFVLRAKILKNEGKYTDAMIAVNHAIGLNCTNVETQILKAEIELLIRKRKRENKL
jgi:hypothetical protein